MAPSQESTNPTEPASKATSAILPQGLASRIFFASPRLTKAMPRANFSTVCARCSNWSATSENRMIGPATSCGNIET